jgi:hypothetical protein
VFAREFAHESTDTLHCRRSGLSSTGASSRWQAQTSRRELVFRIVFNKRRRGDIYRARAQCAAKTLNDIAFDLRFHTQEVTGSSPVAPTILDQHLLKFCEPPQLEFSRLRSDAHMLNNEAGRRTAALVSVMLLASTFVFYMTTPVTSSKATDRSLVTPPAQTTAEIREPSRDQVLPMITVALRNTDFSKARQAVAKLPNEHTRNQLLGVVESAEQNGLFVSITSALKAGEYPEARSVANALRDDRVREEIMQMVDFAEARHALNNGDARTAVSVTKRLHPGLKRALLLTGIAAHLQSRGDRRSSIANLRLAVTDVDHVAYNHRRQLLVMIARVLLQTDLNTGLDVLDRALHETRSANATNGPASIGIAGNAFYECISAGGARYCSSLAVPGARSNAEELLLVYHGRLRCTHGSVASKPSIRTV